ncbi:hypothetical protein, partial [Apilactobacillus timberlakei]|uniref:hypothetical protein n=1 Tax=Apilactobacillus timberlakei TaxID=2008380 RepID=UPI0015E85147
KVTDSAYHKSYSQQQQAAYDNAVKAYQAGSDDNYTEQDQKAAKLNAVANKAGYAEFAGIVDASYGNHNNQNYYANNSHELKVYNNAQSDFFNGLQNNGQDISTTGYDVGQAARQGIEDSTTNTNAANEPNSGYNDWHPIKQAAYNNAQTAYQAGLKNDASSADAQLNQMANTAGLAAYQGATDAAAGNTDNQTKYASDSINSTAYANAQKAYTAGLYVHPNTADAQLNPTAYNVGVAARQEITDSINNVNAVNDPNSDYHKTWTTQQQVAYQNAQKSFQAGMDGDQTEQDKINANLNIPANLLGLAAYKGMNDALSGNNNYINYKGNDQIIYNDAQAAYAAGLAGSSETDVNAAKNIIAYNVGLAAKRGITDYNVGIHEDVTHLTPYNNWNNSQQQAYINAQKAYAAGLSNNQTNADARLNSTANEVGQAAYNGAEDALAGNDNNKYIGDKQVAYANAQTAYTAGLTGQAATTQAAINNPVAYKVGLAAQQAITDSDSNINEAKVTDSAYHKSYSQQQQAAYDNAVKAYQAGSDDNYTEQDQKAAKLNAVANKAGYAEFAGIVDASYGNHNNQNYYANNSHELKVYNNAQ